SFERLLISNSKQHGRSCVVSVGQRELRTQFSPKAYFTIVNSDLASTGSDHKSASYIDLLLLGGAVFARKFRRLHTCHAIRPQGPGKPGYDPAKTPFSALPRI